MKIQTSNLGKYIKQMPTGFSIQIQFEDPNLKTDFINAKNVKIIFGTIMFNELWWFGSNSAGIMP